MTTVPDPALADHALAAWTGGGWRFVAPRAGMAVWSIADALVARHDGTGWQVGAVAAAELVVGGVAVVGAQQSAIADPAGGAAPDIEARTAIIAVLQALRLHGLIAS